MEKEIQKFHFTEDRIDQYFVYQLKFNNWKSILNNNRLEFLTCVLQKSLTFNYWHNLRVSSVPPEKRSCPSIEQIIEMGFNGVGGVCFELSYFLHMLLSSLRFTSYVIQGTFLSLSPVAHFMTVVDLGGVNEQDKENHPDLLYLLDVGGSLPLNSPVPLHSLPHKSLSGGYYYEFRQLKTFDLNCNKIIIEPGEVYYGRYQLGGSFVDGDFINKPNGQLKYYFTLKPKTYEDFQTPVMSVYKDTTNLSIFNTPMLFRYLKHEYCEGCTTETEWVIVFGLDVIVGKTSSRKIISCKDYTELQKLIWSYFPKLNHEEKKNSFKWFESKKGLFH